MIADVIQFLNSIGIPTDIEAGADGFVPGVRIEKGRSGLTQSVMSLIFCMRQGISNRPRAVPKAFERKCVTGHQKDA